MSTEIIYIDESGHSLGGWTSDINKQPYYVLAAIAIPSERYLELEKDFLTAISKIEIPGVKPNEIGYGKEIKAKEIASGSGFWRTNELLRNQVRDLYVGFPEMNNLTTFAVVLDKKAHYEKYAFPANPHKLAVQFLFERIQTYLTEKKALGVCIYDLNPKQQESLMKDVSALFVEGSAVQYYSDYFSQAVERKMEFDPIIEFSFGMSQYSLGLQLADFLATMTYSYMKAPIKSCGWWKAIEKSLYSRNGKSIGWGLKKFPNDQR